MKVTLTVCLFLTLTAYASLEDINVKVDEIEAFVPALIKAGCSFNATDEQLRSFALCYYSKTKQNHPYIYELCSGYFAPDQRHNQNLEGACRTVGTPQFIQMSTCLIQELIIIYPDSNVKDHQMSIFQSCAL